MSIQVYKKTFPRPTPEAIPWAVSQVDLLNAKYLGAFQGEINSFLPPAKKILKPYYYPFVEDTSYISPFLNPNVGPTVAQYYPPVAAAPQSFMLPPKKGSYQYFADPREPRFGIPFDPALLQGIFTSQSNSYITPRGKYLHVRSIRWEEDINFIKTILDNGLLQIIAPTIQQQTYQSYRSRDSVKLDIRLNSWGSRDWIFNSVNTGIPALAIPSTNQAMGSFITSRRPIISRQLNTWDANQGWIQYVTTLAPTVQPLHPPCDVTWYRNFS